MTPRPRQVLRALAKRWVGERPVPVGGLARDRHLLRRGLGEQSRERLLVVGPGLAVRQALPRARVDVLGTSPYRSEVTVCSALTTPRALPHARWDTLVITSVDDDVDRQLGALVPACRPGGRLVVFQRTADTASLTHVSALTAAATLEQVLTSRGRLLLIARIPT